jgi:hypothetical protein
MKPPASGFATRSRSPEEGDARYDDARIVPIRRLRSEKGRVIASSLPRHATVARG